MNGRRRDPARRCGRDSSWRPATGSHAFRAVGLAACLWFLAPPLTAQEPPSLRQLEAAFNSAVLEYEAALGAAAVQRQSWEERMMAWDQVRSSGGGEVSDAALRELERESVELQRLELRVVETAEAAETAKLALLAGLDRRREELEARYAAAADGAEGRQVEALLLDVTAQYRRLENEPLTGDPVQPLYSSITFDPRDREPQLRLKIQMLELRIQLADSTVGEVDRRIERLESLQRIQQMGEDFRAGVGRFDDDLLRTGPPTQIGDREEGMPVDSAAVQDAAPVTQQIVEAKLLREQLVEFRDELARRAEEFRERLRRMAQ